MNFDRVTEYLDSLVSDKLTPGADCIITKDHERIYRHFSGFGDIAGNIAINGSEKYMIFSMTKMLTCVCALQLLEQGKYRLDDPLSDYMPEFAEMKVKRKHCLPRKAENAITIRHLFSMSAGLNYDLNESCVKNAANKTGSNTQTIVSSFSEKVLDFEPGTHFQYSLCHDVLGALIEIWSGMKFRDYLRENLAEPLGMKNTFFCRYHNENVENLAQIYRVNSKRGDFDFEPKINPFIPSDKYDSGGAGLISTTEDYSLFLEALANGGMAGNGNRILKEETVELMRTNQLTGDRCTDFDCMRRGYGYGLGVRTHINPETSGSLSPVGEFGWDGAAGAFSMVDPVNRISLTYFQHAFGWNLKMQIELRNLVYEALRDN